MRMQFSAVAAVHMLCVYMFRVQATTVNLHARARTHNMFCVVA